MPVVVFLVWTIVLAISTLIVLSCLRRFFILSSDAILLIVLPLSFLHIVTMRLNCRCVISLVVTYNLQLVSSSSSVFAGRHADSASGFRGSVVEMRCFLCQMFTIAVKSDFELSFVELKFKE